MTSNFRLVAKFLNPHLVDIFIVFPSGDSFTVSRLLFPGDFQLDDTVKCVEGVEKLLRERYRKSV